MATSNSQKKQKNAVPDHPERFGPSLAHVITIENDKDVVLGQAWVAGLNTLITCGHVVEKFVGSPGSLIVRFPSSGNSYTVREVRLHPNFARQADQLVRFDAAVLLVELQFPEREALPLPLEYEKNVSINQEYSAIRYPVHLGQFTSSPNSLAQIGRMLGPLRKNDNFHLLHDLALAPGDSGCPIFDGDSVVALHCGDTATLPGLNLPTTSIRLALWVDALRDLGVEENLSKQQTNQVLKLSIAGLAFLICFFLSLLICAWQFAYMRGHHVERWLVDEPAIPPITVSFDQRFNMYQYHDPIQLKISVKSPSYVCAYFVDDKDKATMLYPVPILEDQIKVQPEKPIVIDRLTSSSKTSINEAKQKLHVFTKNSPFPLHGSDKPSDSPALEPLKKPGSVLEERFLKEGPLEVSHVVMDLPSAEEIPKFVLDATKPNAQPTAKP